jgi:hypothetical protein
MATLTPGWLFSGSVAPEDGRASETHHKEANEMLSKTRITIVTLIASAGFAAASAVPAVSQAQWHTYCVSGHCITHTNFTSGGVSPCVGANSNLNKANDGLLEAIQKQKEQADKVHPEMTPAETQAGVEDAEAQLHLASIAAFEWGCDVAPAHTGPTSVGKVPVGAVRGSSARR